MFEDQKPVPRLALRIGIAGFIGFGALATGMFVTRKGRHLVREAWQGRERTRRRIDVDETENGHVVLSGTVRSEEERRRAVRIAGDVKGVTGLSDELDVVPRT